MRRRAMQGKLKLGHSLIDGLRPLLEQIAAWPQVISVIPGRIEHTKSRHPALKLTAGVATVTGIKLKAKSRDGAVQEVFIVTSEPEAFRVRFDQDNKDLHDAC